VLRFAAGALPRSRCPRCGALQRHRLLWLFLERETTLLRDGGRVLHFAPEAGIAARLAATAGVDYVSADLEPGAAMLTLDLERLDLPDAAFDWILCLHVLEHVGDDRAAMAELFRVLRPGGTAIVQVPTFGPTTDEDPAVTGPEERRARFGQADHVRLYGADVYDRLAAAGFAVDRRVFRDQLTAGERRRHGLDYVGTPVDYGPIDDVWTIPVCTKPVPS
jgi:SAM-dependent methyltransferase